ncbi:MFS transporter, partial [Acinetobacter baumannii]
LKGAAQVLQESYAIHAVATVEKVKRTAEKKKREGFAVLFNKTYLPRTIVAIVIHISVAFQYTTIAFFLPSILTRFFHTDVLTTITTTLGLNLLFAFTGGLLGVFVASRFKSRHVLLTGF